jgi:hypothetical protein
MVAAYVEAVKDRLLTEPSVVAFHIIRERITISDGHLRARLTLTDESWLEFSEYIQRGGDGQIAVVTYSYHWANACGHLIRRWDNTPHFPELSNFPHHIHEGDAGAVIPGKPVSIFAVLDEVAAVCGAK